MKQWRLTKKEPTEEMIQWGTTVVTAALADKTWKTMLEAAPPYQISTEDVERARRGYHDATGQQVSALGIHAAIKAFLDG